jgi:hypothetical protein
VRCERDAADAPSLCLDAGEELLADLLRRGPDGGGRTSALDLLAADALVTYAFEAAATNPADIERRAADAMHRLSSASEFLNATN